MYKQKIPVGNTRPMFEFESKDDMSAWLRRLRFFQCKSYKPSNPIPDFAQMLLRAEGSGILNWALSGAETILRSGSSRLPCSEHQQEALQFLFKCSDPLDYFLTECVKTERGKCILGEDLFIVFSKFIENKGIRPWTKREFQSKAPDAMLRHFQTPLRRDVPYRTSDGKQTNRSGYYHVAFVQ